MRKGITTAQIKMLYGLARKNGMDSDMLHARVYEVTGSDSIKALSASAAARVIDGLLGKQQSDTRATNAQVGIILGLADKLGWSKQPDRLRGWLRSRWEVELPGWLNSYQARECIEGMKAMLKGGRSERKNYQAAE